MSFEGDINRHRKRRDERIHKVFVACTEEVARSVSEGSEITGAPGQPVQFGTLKGSWIGSFLERFRWRYVTNLVYAEPVENLPESSIRSAVGGPKSVAKTRTGWQRIVAHVGRRFEDK